MPAKALRGSRRDFDAHRIGSSQLEWHRPGLRDQCLLVEETTPLIVERGYLEFALETRWLTKADSNPGFEYSGRIVIESLCDLSANVATIARIRRPIESRIDG
jgi:hypothetical protein